MRRGISVSVPGDFYYNKTPGGKMTMLEEILANQRMQMVQLVEVQCA